MLLFAFQKSAYNLVTIHQSNIYYCYFLGPKILFKLSNKHKTKT